MPATTVLTSLREPSLTILVILELLLFFVVGPLAAMGVPASRLAVFLLMLLILAVSVIVVSRDRIAAAVIALAAAASILVTVMRPVPPTPLTLSLEIIGNMVAMIVLTWIVGKAVLGSGRVTMHRIRGAVAIYLQIGMTFALGYNLISILVPEAFTPLVPAGLLGRQRLFYFSFVTLTSTGFGDSVPVHPIAQSVANVEAIIGQLFPATLLARLVTLELEARRH